MPCGNLGTMGYVSCDWRELEDIAMTTRRQSRQQYNDKGNENPNDDNEKNMTPMLTRRQQQQRDANNKNGDKTPTATTRQ